MFVLFDESGQFKVATIFSEADTTLQVEMPSGKRNKIKRASVIFTFNDYPADTLLSQAAVLANDIDIEFLWEICPRDTFNCERLAKEYYGDKAGTLEKTALLLCLHEHPIYFHRKGKGLYIAAPEDILKAALVAQEKKRLQAEQQAAWTQSMVNGQVPDELREILPSFLNNPDKNTLAWKAFSQALDITGMQVAELLLKLNVFPHALAVHRARFLGHYFPKGVANPVHPIPDIEDLPQANVKCYSVDDVSTTEIDDAFSIQAIDHETFIFGIHIACPAIAVERDSPLDLAARQRMSTVYFPGDKIAMQDNALIETFSLNQGAYVPALSLYVTANIQTGEILNEETKLEKVFIQENLRTNHIEHLLTREALESDTIEIPHADLFRPMWAFSQHLRKAREEVRGKPENNDRIEYLFSLDGSPDDPDAKLILTPRMRNAPLDLIVAEFMILCNSSWAKLLDSLGLPGIFRSQSNGRVRMSTHALPHDTIGVAHYAWTTSPLRRYVDLFNQRQLIAAVKHGISARLVAPYKPKDANIFAIISSFESLYAAYQEHQNRMERYWCLRHLERHQITRLQASVIRDELVRIEGFPLTLSIASLPVLARGSIVDIEIKSIDLYNLQAECRLVSVISTPELNTEEVNE